jgi:hypothetical protein
MLYFFDTIRQEFALILETLAQRDHAIERLLVGGHPNDPLKPTATNQSSGIAPVVPRIRLKSELDKIPLLFGKLIELRLPITVPTRMSGSGNSTAVSVLRSSIDCLVCLTLIGSDMLSRGWYVESEGRSVLKEVLLPTKLRSLKGLGLYGT